MRKRKLPLLENILVTGIASKGKAVAKTIDGQVVFVKGAVPGDIIDIQLIKKKKKYFEGKLKKIRSQSKNRVEPICEHFGICGGCSWQNLSYENQLDFKQNEVKENLQRIAQISIYEQLPILSAKNKLFYRNKLEYSFSSNKWLTSEEIASNKKLKHKNALGFHIPGRFDKILDINYCHLQKDPSNEIRNKLRRFAIENNITFFDVHKKTGDLRSLMIRNTLADELLVFIQFGNSSKVDDVMQFLIKEFPKITSLQFAVNQKLNDSIYDLEVNLYYGKPFITEKINNLKFKIGVKSFFQTNSYQALKLYNIVKKFANINNSDIVYDLYSGTGTIAQILADKAKKVVCIESVEEAVDFAKENAINNNITNCEFVLGDMRYVLNVEFSNKHGKPNVLIVDPPRDGMHPKVLENIIDLSPEKIVYVSCNSATQARDLLTLKEHFDIIKSQAVDMFPHTFHLENVVLLKSKQIIH